MNCVYILQSIKSGKYYIGSTNDIERRIAEHNSGKTKSLRYLRPLKVVFNKTYPNISDARKIEWRLKQFKNKDILERIIKDGEIKTSI